MKKLVSLTLIILSAFCLCACKKSAGTDSGATIGKMYDIGICESDDGEYNSLILSGFSQALSDEMPDDSVTITRETISDNKSGSSIISSFIINDDDLILTMGAPALEAAANGTYDIPIITTDVIGIQSVAGLEELNFDMRTGRNITGVTGMPNIADQLSLVIEVTPGIKTLGIVYGVDDTYSIDQSRIMQSYLMEAGIDAVMYQLTDVTGKKISAICKRCDAIYIPAKSHLASEAEKISDIAAKKGIPTIGGDATIGENTLVCLCPDYYNIGYSAGLQAAKILGKNKDAGRIAIEIDTSEGIKLYNEKYAKKLGMTFPKSFHLYDQEVLNTVLSDR